MVEYTCPDCDFTHTQKRYLTAHIATKHKPENKLPCPHCNYEAACEKYLKEHLIIHTKKPRKCTFCSFEHYSWKRLKVHVILKHKPEKLLKCPYCEFKKPTPFEIKQHIEWKHTEYSADDFVKCSFCEYMVPKHRISQLKTHIKSHTKEGLLQCALCDYNTTSKTQLKSHIQVRHTGDAKYKCEFCKYVSTKKIHLETHVNSKHTWEKMFQCKSCAFCTTSERSLRNHRLKMHSPNAMQLECNQCPYRTPLAYLLVQHKRIHEIVKCQTDGCFYSANPRQMERHVLKFHTDKKPQVVYMCTMKNCAYSGINRNINQHFPRMHSKETDYTCAVCLEKYELSHDLLAHIKETHVVGFDLNNNNNKTNLMANKNKKFKCNAVSLNVKKSFDALLFEDINSNNDKSVIKVPPEFKCSVNVIKLRL